MDFALSLYPLFVAALGGFCLALLFRENGAKKEGDGGLLFPGIVWTGIGAGLLGILFFAALFIGPADAPLRWLESGAAVLLVVICLWRLRSSWKPGRPDVSGWKAAAWVFAAAVVLLVINVAAGSYNFPNGGWDAMGIWNLKAKLLFRHQEWPGAGLPRMPEWTHPDYPPLLAASVARVWKYAGSETLLAPILVGVFWSTLAVSVVPAALGRQRSARIALFAGALPLLSPEFVKNLGFQMADVPLAFFFATALICFHRFDRSGDGATFAAGVLLAGLAAWTKNEGLLCVLAIFTTRTIGLAGERRWSDLLRQSFFFGLLLGPLLIGVAVYKASLHTGNDLTREMTPALLLKSLLEFGRHALILKELARQLLHPGLFGLVSACLGGALILGLDRDRFDAAWLRLLLAPLIVAAGYYAVFLITPHDLQWHLNTALSRLILHLLPALIFAVALVLREDLFEPASKSKDGSL